VLSSFLKRQLELHRCWVHVSSVAVHEQQP